MNTYRYLMALFLMGMVSACQNTPVVQPDELPNIPEDVTRYWISYVDKNEYDSAKMLSAPGYTIEYIDDLIQSTSLAPDESITHTTVENLNCAQSSDSTACVCRFKSDVSEKDSLLLVKLNGQWVIKLEQDTMDNLELDVDSIEDFGIDE
jgi:hypothetical protein